MRAPAELGGLAALADESVHRPGVDEFARHLGPVRNLGIALRDVDDLDAEIHRELGPLFAGRGFGRVVARVRRDVDKRLLDEMRYEARVGAMGDDGRRPVRVGLAHLEHFLAQRIVRAAAGRDIRVGIAAGPGLDAGVEVQRAFLVAQLDQRDARDIDRKIQHEIAATDQRVEHVPEIFPRQRVIDEPDAEFLSLLASGIIRRDDGDPVGRQAPDMAHDQRQDTLANAAKADENQTAGEMGMDCVLGHKVAECTVKQSRCGVTR